MKDDLFEAADEALLEQAVRGLRDDLPDDARMRRLERGLAPVLVADTAPVRWWQGRHIYAAAGSAIVIAGVFAAARHGSEAPVSSPSSQAVMSSPHAPASLVAGGDETPSPSTPVVSVESLPSVSAAQASPAAEVKSKRAPERPPAPPAAGAVSEGQSAPAEDPVDELTLLEEARKALATEPTRTLALADMHAKRFRAPAFAQERERLAIDALVRLDRRADAERRAKLFEATYPTSAHLARVQALVAPPGAP